MKKNLRAGFIFTAIGTYSNFLIQIIVQIVLSRLLTPKNYGVVAIMQVFIIFFAMLVEAGMGPAIIQNKTLAKKDNMSLFNFSAIFAVALAIAFGFFGLVLSWIYKNPVYTHLTWIQAISVLFNGLSVVPTAVLNKRKQFKAVNFSMVVGSLLAGIVGVSLAFLSFGVYALIASAITTAFVNFCFNSFFSNIWFSKNWDIRPLRRILKFSGNQLGFNFINYFSTNSDNILIGKFMGAAPLANYNKAYQLLLLPNTLFLGVISPVLQPVLSEFQDNVAIIRTTYYKIVHILALIGVPLSVFLSSSAKQVIFVMFGSQWGAAVLPFSYLALTVWCQLVMGSTGGVWQARNHTRFLLYSGIVKAFIWISSIIIGVVLGNIDSVASCLTIGIFMGFFWNFYYLTKKSLEDSLFNFLKNFMSPAFLGIIVFIGLELEHFIDPSNVFFSLFIRGLLFLVIMVLYISLTPEKENLRVIFRK
ncbi:MAG: lipopolysaccharide biosynthesis protein [Streptococcaceae bacterium]|nr:lipopolysaccharide biosynthesis protein [Streptococcaceae bacterium]